MWKIVKIPITDLLPYPPPLNINIRFGLRRFWTFFIENLDGAACHRNKDSIDLLKSKFNENLIWLESKTLSHPPFSPDLSACDGYIWHELRGNNILIFYTLELILHLTKIFQTSFIQLQIFYHYQWWLNGLLHGMIQRLKMDFLRAGIKWKISLKTGLKNEQ